MPCIVKTRDPFSWQPYLSDVMKREQHCVTHLLSIGIAACSHMTERWHEVDWFELIIIRTLVLLTSVYKNVIKFQNLQETNLIYVCYILLYIIIYNINARKKDFNKYMKYTNRKQTIHKSRNITFINTVNQLHSVHWTILESYHDCHIPVDSYFIWKNISVWLTQLRLRQKRWWLK